MTGMLGALPIVLVVYGAVAVLWSTRYATAARQFGDPRRALLAMRGIRLALIDVVLAAVGAGLWFDLDLLVGLAVVVGAYELFESTVAIIALREQAHGDRRCEA